MGVVTPWKLIYTTSQDFYFPGEQVVELLPAYPWPHPSVILIIWSGSPRISILWTPQVSHREGNGSPLQCPCLENSGDGGAFGLPSMGLHRVWHDWSDWAAARESRRAMDEDTQWTHLRRHLNICWANECTLRVYVRHRVIRMNEQDALCRLRGWSSEEFWSCYCLVAEGKMKT